MGLQNVWFTFITILWTGFLVLEGFDFGVGMLVPFLGRTDVDRRVLRSTIGPFWDGNEVWLILVGGATFAAFPDWYATMFSAYYLPLFVVLAGLILRAVAFEFRDKLEASRWRHTWDGLMAVGCLLVPLLIGVAFGGLLGGLPIDAQKEFTGSFADLVQPYALCTGVTFVALCLFQAAAFLRLKTTGDLAERATRLMRRVGIAVLVLLVVFTEWTQAVSGEGVIAGVGAWLAYIGAVAATWLAHHDEHRGWAFAGTTSAIGFTVVGFFGELHPNLMVSTTAAAYSITVTDSSSTYSLTLITIITLVMLPVVLLYTAWSYWVFRQRVTPTSIGAEGPPPEPPDNLGAEPDDELAEDHADTAADAGAPPAETLPERPSP